MKRAEYMSQLKAALSCFEQDLQDEIIEDYEEHYEIGLQKGKTEEQISEELGDIEELVKELKKVEPLKEEVEGSKKVSLDKSSTEKEQQEKKEQEQESNDSQSKIRVPKRIILKSKFAVVQVMESKDGQIHLDWTNYNQSNAKNTYEFRSWIQDDIIYAEVVKKNGGFIFGMGGDIQITAAIPKDFPQLDIHSMSGNINVYGLNAQSLVVYAASGSFTMRNCAFYQLCLDTKSGSIEMNQVQAGNMRIDSKSGDLRLDGLQGDLITGRTLSGDIRVNSVRGNNCEFSTASGNITSDNNQAERIRFGSLSGDLEVRHTQGNQLMMDSKSGDLNANVRMKQIQASSISGDVDVMNACEADIRITSVSGDVKLAMSNITGYTANLHSVSGDRSCGFAATNTYMNNCGNGTVAFGSGQCKIDAKTTSGDISIQG